MGLKWTDSETCFRREKGRTPDRVNAQAKKGNQTRHPMGRRAWETMWGKLKGGAYRYKGPGEGQGFAFGHKDTERPVKHLHRMDLDVPHETQTSHAEGGRR